MRKRFTEEQIIRILNQGESGEKVKDIVREHGHHNPLVPPDASGGHDKITGCLLKV